jgi:hypothetical protein
MIGHDVSHRGCPRSGFLAGMVMLALIGRPGRALPADRQPADASLPEIAPAQLAARIRESMARCDDRGTFRVVFADTRDMAPRFGPRAKPEESKPILVLYRGRARYEGDGTRWRVEYDSMMPTSGSTRLQPDRWATGFDGDRRYDWQISKGLFQIGPSLPFARQWSPRSVIWERAEELIRALEDTAHDRPRSRSRSGRSTAPLGQGVAGGEVRRADRLAPGDLVVEAAGEGDGAGVRDRFAMADRGGEAGVLDEVGAEVPHPGRRRPAGVEQRQPDQRALEDLAEPRRRHLLAALLVLEPEVILLAMPEEVEDAGLPPPEGRRGQLAAELIEGRGEDPSQPDRHRRPPDLGLEVGHLDRQVQRRPHIQRRRAEQQHVQILGALASTTALDRHDRSRLRQVSGP